MNKGQLSQINSNVTQKIKSSNEIKANVAKAVTLSSANKVKTLKGLNEKYFKYGTTTNIDTNNNKPLSSTFSNNT